MRNAVGFGMLYVRMGAALLWHICVIRLWSECMTEYPDQFSCTTSVSSLSVCALHGFSLRRPELVLHIGQPPSHTVLHTSSTAMQLYVGETASMAIGNVLSSKQDGDDVVAQPHTVVVRRFRQPE